MLKRRYGVVNVCILVVLSLALIFISACAAQAPSTAPTGGLWPAPGWQPPASMVIRGPGGTGTGYAMMQGIVATIEDETGVKIAFPPTDDTIAQFAPIKAGEAQFTNIMPDDAYLGIEGIMMFKDAGWPPQSFRSVWWGSPIPQGWVTRDNSGIRTLNDMVGKKVAQTPPGSTDDLVYQGLFAYTKSHPKFTDLSWDNLKPVPVAGFTEGVNAVMTGATDVSVVSGYSAAAQEMAAAIGGLHWIPLPSETAEDKAAWKALQSYMPAYAPFHNETDLPGATKENPADIWAAYYQVIAYDFYPEENLVYWFTMQMDQLYDKFKDKHRVLVYWNMDNFTAHVNDWFIPVHPGTVRYMKDTGVWTPAMDAKQAEMLKKYPQTNTR